jgi:hypothetical protein
VRTAAADGVPETNEIVFRYDPLPPQQHFRSSPAKIRGYGGAMGGGKSRAGCEEVLDLCVEYGLKGVGLKVLIARQHHTSITETTKKTMLEQVIVDPRMIVKRKESGGEDYIQLDTGASRPATIHFIGLEDPLRWYSSEMGLLFIDEAQEVSEETVVRLNTRLRQTGAPNRVIITFNPSNLGHWLQQWFVLGADEQTPFGFYKRELRAEGATRPIGDCEFIFASAMHNIYLPDGYVDEQLGGLPEVLRRRYLEGEWLFTSGTGFFDQDALTEYSRQTKPPRWTGTTEGDPAGKDPKDKPRFKTAKQGPWWIWKLPVRQRTEDGRTLPGHRYIAAVDVSSGGSADYSAIQVLDIEEYEVVAEYQAKLDPDQVAIEACRIGHIYNKAWLAPETTGGWGFTITQEMRRHKYPRPYTRPVLDRLSRKMTDKLGWDTTTRTRAHMLDTLERLIRERDLKMYSQRTLAELVTFVRDDKGRPGAQPNTNDDLVTSLAIAVAVAGQLPRQHRPLRPQPYRPAVSSVTGY